jgi:hypothetical protein
MTVLIKLAGKTLLINLTLMIAASPLAIASDNPTFARSLNGKFIVGYQGWFGCPGDDGVNQRWIHWFRNTPTADDLTVDFWPSQTAYDSSELYPTSMERTDGTQVSLYSAQSRSVVLKHFKWMEQYGIAGAACQRFVCGIRPPESLSRLDRVLVNEKAGAEASGRVFFVTYDVSGANSKTVLNDIEEDWKHLVNDLKVTSSPNYLFHRGKPVLEIWGFGFSDRPGEAASVADLLNRLKTGAAGMEAVTIMGGVPTNWRTLSSDSKSDPLWARTYRMYDIISPWSVGRYANDADEHNFMQMHVLPDMQLTKALGIDYMPVVFPGFSWHNLKSAKLNQIPRHGGSFYWNQIVDRLKAGSNMMYGAMFDECDEGTALYKLTSRLDKLPAGAQLNYLNIDGSDLPDDYYLTLTGRAKRYLQSQQVPVSNR